MSTATDHSNQQVRDAQSNTNDKGTSTEKQDEAVYKKPEGEELLDAIRKQVEYYFSRQNLANDPFLVQHMNHQLYVPIEFIASFKLVKNLTDDVNLIRDAMKDSKSVILDETQTKLKPDFNLPRNTVILRDIPSTTDVEEVRRIFSSDNLPKQIQSQIGDNWFIIFETDEQALNALDQIRGKEINGHAVHARIKTENILKAFTFGLPVPQQQQQPQSSYQSAPYRGNFRTAQPWESNSQYQGGRRGSKSKGKDKKGGQQQQQQPQSSQAPQQQQPQSSQKKGQGAPQEKRPKSAKQSRVQPVEPLHITAPSQQPQQAEAHLISQPTTQQQQQQDTSNPHAVGRGKRRPSFTRGHPPPSLGTKNFPPLPTISKADLLKSGYENDKYLSYPKGAIISVYNNNIKGNIERPADMPDDCPAVLSKPKTQLELTKPPLPHHEVQQHPEHIEEESEHEHHHEPQQQQQQQVLKSETAPKKSSPLVASSAPSVAPSELPPVAKSFAEAAITAKDIKTPDFVRPEPKRRNSLKGKLDDVAPQQQQQQQQQPKSGSRNGRRNSIGGGRRRRNSLEAKDTKRSQSPNDQVAAPAQTGEAQPQQPTQSKTKRKRTNKKSKPQDAQNQAPAQTQNQSVSPISGDNKSYASIVNKVKDAPSPKTTEHQASPKTSSSNDNTTQQSKISK